MFGIEGALDGPNDFALHRKGFARNSSARGGRMAAASELGRDFVHVYMLALGAETDASHLRLNFLEDAGDHDGRDSANMIDQPFGVTALSPGAGEVRLLKPEIRNLILMRQTEV